MVWFSRPQGGYLNTLSGGHLSKRYKLARKLLGDLFEKFNVP